MAIVFDLAVAERVLDRAVDLEGHAVAAPEPFSRSGQRGGLVAGELVLGAAVAFLLAGVATFLGGRARSGARLWALMAGAAIWSVVVLPAAVYPPLPPGVDTELGIGSRQALYLAVVAVGLTGSAAALYLWSTAGRLRIPLALGALLLPVVPAVLLLPDPHADTRRLPAGLLTDFRLVSIAGQLLFWATIALAGTLLLRPTAARQP